jgi:microcin C transport system ATP-binding protein
MFVGRDVLTMSDSELRGVRGARIGMVFQDPMTSLNPLHRLEKQLGESLALHRGISGKAARPLIIDALSRVGLRDAEKRLGAYPHELSGGERQRVMIALALLNKPVLLIADEPTTALDVAIQSQILDLLRELQRELGMAVLFITHNLTIVQKIADRVIVMKDGLIIEEGVTENIFSNPLDPYTKLLVSDGFETESASNNADDAPVVAEGIDICVHYPIKSGFFRRTTGWIKAVDGVSFTLRKGQTLGIVGESGSGKSTLGKALLRLIPSGTARLSGILKLEGVEIQNMDEKALRPLRRKLQIIFQDPYGSLSPRQTVRQIVGEGLRVHKLCPASEIESRVQKTLAEVGLTADALDRYPSEFSGGQRQRIALARSLILEPLVLVLDEPTSSLDRTVQFQVVRLLKELQAKKGLSYIFISHDLPLVHHLCNDIVIMGAE